ncbi:hypothetical protein CLOM_g13793 [Closterium sp. NIES-68]|nr:hypothetical protein CLOM_g13793 [Closterium sp. NIES-68]GJP83602.1 hypothetical protein CLOP_g13734 [Closterium sp. NIES-67]
MTNCQQEMDNSVVLAQSADVQRKRRRSMADFGDEHQDAAGALTRVDGGRALGKQKQLAAESQKRQLAASSEGQEHKRQRQQQQDNLKTLFLPSVERDSAVCEKERSLPPVNASEPAARVTTTAGAAGAAGGAAEGAGGVRGESFLWTRCWTEDAHNDFLNWMESEFVSRMYSRAYCHEDICGVSSVPAPQGQLGQHTEGIARDLHAGSPAKEQLEQRQHQSLQRRDSYQPFSSHRDNQQLQLQPEQEQHQHQQQLLLQQQQQLYAPWNTRLPQHQCLPTQCDITSADTSATLLPGASVPPPAAPCCSGTGSFSPLLDSRSIVQEASGSVGSCCRAQGDVSGAGELGGEEEEPGECAVSRSCSEEGEDRQGRKDVELRSVEDVTRKMDERGKKFLDVREQQQQQGQHLQVAAMQGTDWTGMPRLMRNVNFPAAIAGYAISPFHCRDGAATSMIATLPLPVYLPPPVAPPPSAAAVAAAVPSGSPPMGFIQFPSLTMLPSGGQVVSPFFCTNSPLVYHGPSTDDVS